jgi:hypothetical protein
MTETDEIAESILKVLHAPPSSYGDAECIAARYVGNQGKTVEANVAAALWRMISLKDGCNATIPD